MQSIDFSTIFFQFNTSQSRPKGCFLYLYIILQCCLLNSNKAEQKDTFAYSFPFKFWSFKSMLLVFID